MREEKVELLHTHCPIASAILARSLREVVDAPLVLTYHTKYDIDIAKAVKSRLLQESAIRALVQNVNACDEVWVVEPRRGRESALARLRGRVHRDGEWRGRAARARERRGGRRCDSGL